MMMFSLLCVLGIYSGINVHFLEAGHSHGSPDVAVAHAKRPLKKNYNVPEEIVDTMNTVEGIHANYIDFRDANTSDEMNDYIFRTGWESLFGEYFVPLPKLKG